MTIAIAFDSRRANQLDVLDIGRKGHDAAR